MAKKLLILLFTFAIAFSLATAVFAQSNPAEAKAPAAGKAAGKVAKEGRWEGMVVRSNKDKSTLTVRSRDTDTEKTVEYDSSTQWESQEHGSKTVNKITAADVKDDDRVICIGTWENGSVLKATKISKRLTN